MGASITITGIPPYDGDYPLDMDERFLTNREVHELKKETGVRAGEIQEALEAGDNDVLLMLAVFAIRWSGKPIHPNVLWDAKAGSIDFNKGDEEVEDEESLPPPSEPETPSDEAEKKPSSGVTSTRPSEPTETISEPSPVTPIRTGPPDSDTGAISDQAISAI